MKNHRRGQLLAILFVSLFATDQIYADQSSFERSSEQFNRVIQQQLDSKFEQTIEQSRQSVATEAQQSSPSTAKLNTLKPRPIHYPLVKNADIEVLAF